MKKWLILTVVIISVLLSSMMLFGWLLSGAQKPNLLEIWGTSSSDVFVVGESGTMLHYDGKTWSRMKTPAPGTISHIWGSSSSDVFAVGTKGTIVHYDGSTWSPMNSGTTSQLGKIWGTSS